MPFPPQGIIQPDIFYDHKVRHQNAGLDEISVLGLSGLLADDQHVLDAEVLAVAAALVHKTRHQNGGADKISVAALSGLLADDQHVLDAEVLAVAAALVHKTRHQNGGADKISVAALSGLLADDQHVLDAEVDVRLGALDATCWVVASDAKAEILAYAGRLQAAGYPVWVCDATADEVQIQAANDACAGVGGTVQLSGGNFYIQDDLNIGHCTLRGQGPGGPTVNMVTKLTLSDTKTITLRREGSAAPYITGRLHNLGIFCPDGFTGTAVAVDGTYSSIGDVKSLLKDVRIWNMSWLLSSATSGTGLHLFAVASDAQRFITACTFENIAIEGFDIGLYMTGESSLTDSGWINENTFINLALQQCEKAMVLDNTTGAVDGSVDGNKFLPVYIETHNGAISGIHFAGSINRNYAFCWDWTQAAWYSSTFIVLDADTHENCIEGHFDDNLGITDNSTVAIGNRVFRLTKREPSAKVYNSQNISIDDSNLTVLTFDSEEYDTEGMHSTSSNTNRLTCKTAGRYLIIGTVHWAGDGPGRRDIYIREGGDNWVGQQVVVASDGVPIIITVSTIVELAVDDYVELAVYQVSGGALNVQYQANYSPYFMMHKVGY